MRRLQALWSRTRKIPFVESNLKMSPMTLVRFATAPLKSKSTATLLGRRVSAIWGRARKSRCWRDP